MNTRPGILRFVSILNIILGAFTLFGMLSSLLLMASPDSMALSGGVPNPVITAMRDNPDYAFLFKLMIAPNVIGAAIAIASGVLLLKASERGRKLALAWAVLVLLISPVGLYTQLRYVLPALENMPLPKTSHPLPPEAEAIMRTSIKIGTLGGALLGIVLTSGYALFILIGLTRPKVKGYCKAASAGAAGQAAS